MLTLAAVTVPTGCQSFHLGKAVVFQSSFRGMPVYVKSKFGFRIVIVVKWSLILWKDLTQRVFPPPIAHRSVLTEDSNSCPPDQVLGSLTKELASRLLVWVSQTFPHSFLQYLEWVCQWLTKLRRLRRRSQADSVLHVRHDIDYIGVTTVERPNHRGLSTFSYYAASVHTEDLNSCPLIRS